MRTSGTQRGFQLIPRSTRFCFALRRALIINEGEELPQQTRATESARALSFVVAAGRTAGCGENGAPKQATRDYPHSSPVPLSTQVVNPLGLRDSPAADRRRGHDEPVSVGSIASESREAQAEARARAYEPTGVGLGKLAAPSLSWGT